MTNFVRNEYRPDIDGLRAIAVIAVLIFHAFPSRFPGMFIGVDIFFVISGYLISKILLSEIADDKFTFTNFYSRRINRIFPSLIVVLVVVMIAGVFLLSKNELSKLGLNVIAGALFSSNIAALFFSGYFDSESELNPLLNLWSLGIEEQYYIFWPFLLLGCKSFSFRAKLQLFIGLFFISFLSSIYLSYSNSSLAYYLPLTRAWELIAGSIVALIHIEFYNRFRDPNWQPKCGSILFTFGMVLIGAGFLVTTRSTPFPGWVAIFPVFGTAIVIFVLSGRGGIFQIFLGNRVFVYIGLISYPLYLVHWPVLVYSRIWSFGDYGSLQRIQAVIASVVLAVIFYELIEKKIRHRKDRTVLNWQSMFMCLIALSGAILFFCAESLSLKHESNFSAELRSVAAQGKIDDQWNRGSCFLVDSNLFHAAEFEKKCSALGASGKKRIALIGDSHAAALIPGLMEVLGRNYELAQFTAAACIPLILKFEPKDNRVATSRCEKINDVTLQELARYKPEIIIVGTYFFAYSEQKGWSYPHFIYEYNNALKNLQINTRSKVILVGQVPIWDSSLPQVASKLSENGDVPSRTKFGLNSASLNIDTKLKTIFETTDIKYISLSDKICNETGCLIFTDGQKPSSLFSYDYGHLSPNGSRWIAQNVLLPEVNKYN